jgi:methyl-accepting chemotaxis protein
MGLINTKKAKMETAKKIEDSYNQGKIDAILESLATIEKGKEDKSKWNELREKELMVELMYSLSLNSIKLDNINSKIGFISNYEELFKIINDKVNELSSIETDLHTNVAKSTVLVSNFAEDINELNKSVEKKINEMNKSLDEQISELKGKVDSMNELLKEMRNSKKEIDKLADSLSDSLPKLGKACDDIGDVSTKVNKEIEKYKDSPMEKINNVQEDIKKVKSVLIKKDEYNPKRNDSIFKKIDEIEYTIFKLDSLLFGEKDGAILTLAQGEDDLIEDVNGLKTKVDELQLTVGKKEYEVYDSIYDKVDDIQSTVNSISDNFGVNNLDDDISEIKSTLSDIQDNMNSSSNYSNY